MGISPLLNSLYNINQHLVFFNVFSISAKWKKLYAIMTFLNFSFTYTKNIINANFIYVLQVTNLNKLYERISFNWYDYPLPIEFEPFPRIIMSIVNSLCVNSSGGFFSNKLILVWLTDLLIHCVEIFNANYMPVMFEKGGLLFSWYLKVYLI